MRPYPYNPVNHCQTMITPLSQGHDGHHILVGFVQINFGLVCVISFIQRCILCLGCENFYRHFIQCISAIILIFRQCFKLQQIMQTRFRLSISLQDWQHALAFQSNHRSIALSRASIPRLIELKSLCCSSTFKWFQIGSALPNSTTLRNKILRRFLRPSINQHFGLL